MSRYINTGHSVSLEEDELVEYLNLRLQHCFRTLQDYKRDHGGYPAARVDLYIDPQSDYYLRGIPGLSAYHFTPEVQGEILLFGVKCRIFHVVDAGRHFRLLT